MQSRTVITKEDAARLADYLVGLPLPITLTWREGRSRSLDQNALLHKWYGEIATQTHSEPWRVKGECHLKYGLPIRSRDPVFLWLWERTGNLLPYEKQVSLLGQTGELRITSAMKVKELTEYMDAMQRDYRAQGVQLTEPDR